MGGDEFALIADLFAPLATHPGARGLRDDAAVWTPSGPFVVTCDAVVEGVHFLPDDPVDTIAQKAIRVNLSDLAAKAARADGVLIALMWPNARPASQIAAFAQGLKADIAAFGFALLGGDLTATPGPLAIAVTAFGGLVGACSPARAGAAPGQDVWVTGAIGDGALGLRACRGALSGTPQDLAWLADRYRRPQPRLALAAALAAHAGAAMDVSDGLIADAGKLAAASGVALRIEPQDVPLSRAARVCLDAGQARLSDLLCGGDDYEVLFTAAPTCRAVLLAAAQQAGVALSRVGVVLEGAGVTAGGLETLAGGYTHRLGG